VTLPYEKEPREENKSFSENWREMSAGEKAVFIVFLAIALAVLVAKISN
jgi:hypothetical protein